MTVTTTANSISYAGNGTTTAFAFPYIFFTPSDLVVTLIVTATNVPVSPAPVLNGAATYDYTVSGVLTDGEYASGGTITFNTAPLATHTVSMQRVVPATQLVTLIDNTKFPADTINTEFDKLTVLAQQSAYLTTTSLQIPSSEAGLVVTATPVASRANKLLLWDSTGNLSTIDTANLIGGSVPAGPAAGDLAGTYPSPTIKADVALSGNPTAATQAVGNASTRLATTAFVAAAGGVIIREVTVTTPTNLINLFSLGVKSVDVMWSLIPTTASTTARLRFATGIVGNSSSTYFTIRHFNNIGTAGADTLSNQVGFLVIGANTASATAVGRASFPSLTGGQGTSQWWHTVTGGTILVNAGLSGPSGGDGLYFSVDSGNFAAGSFVRVVGWP